MAAARKETKELLGKERVKAVRRNKSDATNGLDTVLVEEALTEGAEPYADLLRRLKKAIPGTERYESILCELSVQANVMKVKSQVAEEVIEEYLDSLD
ncbi:MAG: hypothetical protein ACRD18_08270 [Terriglobia bacterium]